MSCIKHVRQVTIRTTKYLRKVHSIRRQRGIGADLQISLINSQNIIETESLSHQQFDGAYAMHVLELDIAVGQVRGIIKLNEHSDAIPLSGCKCKTSSGYTNTIIGIADNVIIVAQSIW